MPPQRRSQSYARTYSTSVVGHEVVSTRAKLQQNPFCETRTLNLMVTAGMMAEDGVAKRRNIERSSHVSQPTELGGGDWGRGTRVPCPSLSSIVTFALSRCPRKVFFRNFHDDLYV